MSVKHTTINMKQAFVAKADTFLGDDGKIHEEPCSGILIAREGQEIEPSLFKRHPEVAEHFGMKAKEPEPESEPKEPESGEKAEEPKAKNKSAAPAAKNKAKGKK